MRLAASAVPPERLRLVVACCCQLLELRGQLPKEPGEKHETLWAATEAFSQGVRAGLLHQILRTFTDTQSTLRALLGRLGDTAGQLPKRRRRCAQEPPTSCHFREQAQQMLRVAHLVLVCCP